MFADVKKMNNAEETSDIYYIRNPVLKGINRVHTSLRINSIVSLPLKRIWNRFNYLEHLYNQDDIFILVFTNVSIRKVYMPYLQELKARKNVKVILVAVDSFVDSELSPLPYMNQFKFDNIYSFDSSDCEKYNLKHTVSLYSKRSDIKPSSDKSDLFWIGRAKDRLAQMLEIVDGANQAGLVCNFYILGVNKEKRKFLPGVTYIDSVMPYDEVLPQILSTKCLLDIVQNGQIGMTMRVYEAIFYNKKLVTNNSSVKALSYYSAENMQIIDSTEQIDFAFLSNGMDVDYGYKGEYSPINFLHTIIEDLKKERKL